MKAARLLFLAAFLPAFLAGGSGPALGESGIKAENTARIKLSFKDREITVKLTESAAGRDFLSLLPLSLQFEDYAGTEKISHLPRKLDTSEAPPAVTPKRGDFTYYAPWGNLAVFYRDFRRSPGLVILGSIEAGLEYLDELDNSGPVRIERLDQGLFTR